MKEPNYFDVRRFRKEVAGRFTDCPLTDDRHGTICARILPGSTRILEIGAGAWPFLSELKARGFRGTFKTMDVNTSLPFDYYSVDDIEEIFDAVLIRDVIEHMPRPEVYLYLEKVYSILTPGGCLVITTPNTWSPSRVFADYTHISPWPPADLYGVLKCYGFENIEIIRAVWPSRYLAIKRLYWALHSRFYDIDYADTCILIARKLA